MASPPGEGGGRVTKDRISLPQSASLTLVQRGLGSEADWGIVNGQAITDGRIIGAVGNPSDKKSVAKSRFLPPPFTQGRHGAVRTRRRNPVGACCRARRILNLNDCRWQSYLDSQSAARVPPPKNVGAAISRPPAQIPTVGNGRQIASPTVGTFTNKKIHDVIGNFSFYSMD